ncbi:MAG: hypothetical protein V3U90_08480 [Dehalococcoidia bacterium]
MEVSESNALRQQVKSLEAKTKEARDLCQQVRQLEGRNKEYVSTLTDLYLKNQDWQSRAKVEREARQKAEQQSEEYRQRGQQLWQENEELKILATNLEQTSRWLCAQLNELLPLKVWADHPCGVCGKPVKGAVDRETAARLMKDFGHKDCLKKQNSNLGKPLLAGGAALYGLSRLR